MSPTRYSNFFRNRWTALIWAAGICWTAVEFTACTDIGGNDTEIAANAVSPAEDAANMKQLQALVAQIERK